MLRQRLLATTALAVVLAAQVMSVRGAWAADLLVPGSLKDAAPLPAAAPQGFCPAEGWLGGAYIGAHAGYFWGQTDSDFSENGPVDASGFMGGLHLGCMRQFSNGFLLGLEGDVAYTDHSARHEMVLGEDNLDMRFRSNLQGSLRLRAGMAFDKTMVYATGGIAAAQGRAKLPGITDSNVHFGWTIGAGIEHAFTHDWMGRIEVRHTDFGSRSYATVGDVDFKQTGVVFGISRKF